MVGVISALFVETSVLIIAQPPASNCRSGSVTTVWQCLRRTDNRGSLPGSLRASDHRPHSETRDRTFAPPVIIIIIIIIMKRLTRQSPDSGMTN